MLNNIRFKIILLICLFVINLTISGCGCGNNRHYIKGRELYRDKDIVNAINELKIAHKEEPKNVAIITFLAKIYYENKNYEDAIEMYQKALKIVPNDIQIHFNIAKVYKDLGNGNLAKEHFNKVIEINPKGKLANEAQKLINECDNISTQTTNSNINNNITKNNQSNSSKRLK